MRSTRSCKEDPKVIDAWFMLGNMSERRGVTPRRSTHFKRALVLKPDYEVGGDQLAKAYRSLGRDDEAMSGSGGFWSSIRKTRRSATRSRRS